MTAQDRWSRWLLERRFGGDEAAAERGMRHLYAVRDRVLEQAQLGPGMTLLDVGTGDGLIAFGALDHVGAEGHVVFSDVSQPLLDHDRTLAEEIGVLDRCSFVRAPADDLSPIADESVDAVTTRSVLIYVADKAAAFREFHRVLKPGGRVALFEPINRFNETSPRPWPGEDVVAVRGLAQRLRAFYRGLQPLDSDPMMNFDERDLLRLCEAAGFRNLHLEFHAFLLPAPRQKWEAFINSPGNPNIPPLIEAMEKLLTPAEREQFEAHVRPRVESGGGSGASAIAYLRATKDSHPPEDQANV